MVRTFFLSVGPNSCFQRLVNGNSPFQDSRLLGLHGDSLRIFVVVRDSNGRALRDHVSVRTLPESTICQDYVHSYRGLFQGVRFQADMLLTSLTKEGDRHGKRSCRCVSVSFRYGCLLVIQ